MNTIKQRPWPAAALFIVMCLGLSACGATPSASPSSSRTTRSTSRSTTPTSTTPTSTTPTSTTPDLPVTQCTTSQLRLSYQGLYGTAGTEHEWFAFTNVGVGTCSLYGYPGFQPLDVQGQPLPEDLVRTEQPGSNFNGGQSYGPPRTVDLGPGKTAHFQVAFGGTYPIPGQTCYSVSSIEVWPPNQTEALRIATNVNMSTKYCGPTPKPIIDIGPVITAKEGA